MDLESVQKESAKLLRNDLCSEKIHNDTFSSMSNRKLSKEVLLNDAERKPPILISRRTPLHSPSSSYVFSRSEYASRSRMEDKVPMKRCFSKEVLELSRHQIIVTKKSKVDVSMLPPKRTQLDDFKYPRSLARNNREHHNNRSSSSILNGQRNEHLKQIKPPSSKLLVPSSQGNSSNNKPHDRYADERSSRSKSKSTAIVTSKNVNTSHFLISVNNFPLEEWRANNYDGDMLREIIFLSEANAVPVTLIQKEGRLIVKFENCGNTQVIPRIEPRVKRRTALCLFKSPFTLTFKIISAVIRWILGY